MIYFQSGKDSIEWHVGESWGGQIKVEEVCADGDELNYIINNFPNIPYNKRKRHAIYKGEMAQFISDNI